jgi:two-component system, chemotaxis family, CheB/CheR fusion protein
MPDAICKASPTYDRYFGPRALTLRLKCPGLVSRKPACGMPRLRPTLTAAGSVVTNADGPVQLTHAHLAAIVESSDDAIISKTLTGQIVSWNAAAERLFGHGAQAMIGNPITAIIPAERLAEEQEILARICHGEHVDPFDTIRLAADGRRVEVTLRISPVRGPTGQVVGAFEVAREIGDRKLAERIQAQLAAIVESSDDAIVSKNLDGIIQSWNAAATSIFGHTADEAVGQPITLIIPTHLHAEERGIIARVRAGKRVEHFDTVRITKDGRLIPVSLTVSPIHDAKGTVIGASKIARDISERRRAEKALRETEEGLRVANQRKDEFMALLAHELRNPLAPIRYALAAGKQRGATPEQRERFQEIIDRQVAHMSRLLDDLLNVAHITRGTLELRKSTMELTSVLGTAIEAARPFLDAKQHQLSVELPAEAPRLNADPIRLAQVFSNLLINAAKYTDPGGQIRITASTERDTLLVAVRDTGIGIPAEMMPRLFEMFSQAPHAVDRSQGGLGLGLALVRGIVQLHGGSVSARSDGTNRGSEFTVRLPLGVPASIAQASAQPISPVDAAAMRVLVVDDNEDAAEMCATLLQLAGHDVRRAYNGRSALALAKAFRPRVVLLDIGLPDIDGYEVARALRRVPWAAGVLLIAVSGWGQEMDKQHALEAGFDYHLTKPIDLHALERVLQPVTQ